MNRTLLIAISILMLGMVAGCAPSIVVTNRTSFPVRVVLSSSGGSEILSPSPGESSTAEVSEGAFRATAIPDQEWIDYAKQVRKYLNDQLANADQLTGPQLLDVVRRLKEIATKMQDYERAAEATASCSSSVSEDKGGLVEVSTGPDGKIVVVCK